MIFSNFTRFYCLFSAIAGWFAVMLQAYFTFSNSIIPILSNLGKFFSYFTILTNILAAICFTFLYFGKPSKISNWFANAKTITGINIYIFTVGLVYNLVLRGVFIPLGLERLANELLHVVMPLAFLIFWIFFLEKSSLKWKDAFIWLLYPSIYLVYIFIRGAFVNKYPYFFIDANKLDTTEILINCLILMVYFLVLSWLFIGIAKLISKSTQI